MENEWFWEGNVVRALAEYLRNKDWKIERTANTESRETGVDIFARKGEEVLLIEIKGYPSKNYQRGKKKGTPKVTAQGTQARHWFGEVLLSAILRQTEHPTATVAIALPDFTVYNNLIRRSRNALNKLGILIFVVKKNEPIEIIKPF